MTHYVTDEGYGAKFPHRARSMTSGHESKAQTIFPRTVTPLRQNNERGNGLVFISYTGKLHRFQSQQELKLLLDSANKKSDLPIYILRDEKGVVSDPASYSDAPNRDQINKALLKRTSMSLDELARLYDKQENARQVEIKPVSAGVVVRRRKGAECYS